MTPEPQIALRPYGEGDFELLQATLGDPEMTRFLGGPESAEKLQQRHERYLALRNSEWERMFVILAGAQRAAAGTIGYWEHEHQGEAAWETGWSVLPAFQQQGLATRATLAVIDLLRADGRRRSVYAFPTVENLASNAICRKAGFTLEGVSDYEYPKGNPIRCNIWRLDLQANKS
ncbi:MAG: GNAT family N-acetyltransferase [Anaerolineales bacterium]|nr:GNAT family N-acetyltransferase [Anaerolineales bacterium]MCW5855082.1 GNAT family N-acetyltransferase [Anaerolineales bacterium]